jgi:hypothetical protein
MRTAVHEPTITGGMSGGGVNDVAVVSGWGRRPRRRGVRIT